MLRHRTRAADCIEQDRGVSLGWAGSSMRAYNLFRHRDKPHLLCAVPEDCEVPGFIAERAWSFDRKVTEPVAVPIGFDVLAARHGVRLNGFYLFQSFGTHELSGRARGRPYARVNVRC